MEHKYINNPHIYNFLQQFDVSMWDDIIGDLIMNGINEIKRRISEIVTFKNCKCPPMQCGINFINEAAEKSIDQNYEKYNIIKLKNLEQKINNINLNNVNKSRSKSKKMNVKKNN